MVMADQCRGHLPSKIICNTPYAKSRKAWRLTGSSLYATTRTDLTPRFGRSGCRGSPLGVTRCRINTELAAYRLLHRLQGRYIPVFSLSFVFVLLPSLLPFIPSPTSFKDRFLSVSPVLAWRSSSLVLTSRCEKQRGFPAKS